MQMRSQWEKCLQVIVELVDDGPGRGEVPEAGLDLGLLLEAALKPQVVGDLGDDVAPAKVETHVFGADISVCFKVYYTCLDTGIGL